MMLLLLFACGIPQKWTESAGPMTSVWIEVAKGNVKMEGGMGGIAELGWKTEGKVSTSANVERQVLRIDGHCTFRFGCRSDLDLQLPRNMPLTVVVGEGTISLDTLDDSMQLKTEKGDITAINLSSPKVRIESEWGNIKLQFKKIPKSVDVNVVIGDIEVELPYALYSVTPVEKGSTPMEGGIPVHVATSSGKVKVIKRAPDAG